MNKTIALALYEYKGRINLKADLISLLLIAVLLASRLFAGQVAEDSPPIKLGLFFEQTNSASYGALLSEMDKLDIPVFNSSTLITEKLKSGELDAYITICEKCEEPTIKVVSEQQFTAIKYVESIKDKLEPILLPNMFEVSSDLYKSVINGFTIQFVASNKDVYQQFLTLNTLFMVLTIVGVLSAFAFLLQGITDEKDTKVTLMYMSCMKVKEWIDSKVIASTCLSLKNFVFYVALGGIGLTYFGVIELTNAEWSEFLQNKLVFLAVTFAIGYAFWCYLFALVSVLINDTNSPIKSAAVLLPMTAFGIVLSMLDFVSSQMFEFLNFLPLTYLFTMSASIVLTEVNMNVFILSSLCTLILTIVLRSLAIKFVKFDS